MTEFPKANPAYLKHIQGFLEYKLGPAQKEGRVKVIDINVRNSIYRNTARLLLTHIKEPPSYKSFDGKTISYRQDTVDTVAELLMRYSIDQIQELHDQLQKDEQSYI